MLVRVLEVVWVLLLMLVRNLLMRSMVHWPNIRRVRCLLLCLGVMMLDVVHVADGSWRIENKKRRDRK